MYKSQKDFLQKEAGVWVEEGIISEEQAKAIVKRYDAMAPMELIADNVREFTKSSPPKEGASSGQFSWGLAIAGLLVLFGITILLGDTWKNYSLYIQLPLLGAFILMAIGGTAWATYKREEEGLFKEGVLLVSAFSFWIVSVFGPYTLYKYMYGLEPGASIGRFAIDTETWLVPLFLVSASLCIFLAAYLNKSMSALILYYISLSYGIVELIPYMNRFFKDYYTAFYVTYFVLICLSLALVIYWIRKEETKKVLLFWWFFFLCGLVYIVAMFVPSHYGILLSLVSMAYTIGVGKNKTNFSSFVGMRFFAIVGLLLGAIFGSSGLSMDWSFKGTTYLPLWSYWGFIAGAVIALVMALKWPMEKESRSTPVGIALFVSAVSLLHMANYFLHLDRLYIQYAYNGLLGVLAAYMILSGLSKDSLRIFNLGLLLLIAFTFSVLQVQWGFSIQVVGTIFVLEGLFFLICNTCLYRKNKKKRARS